MKHLLKWLAVFFCLPALAINITFTAADVQQQAQGVRRLVLVPLEVSSVNPLGFTAGDSKMFVTDTNSSVTASNLIGGTFMALYRGPYQTTTNYYTFPSSNISDYATNPTYIADAVYSAVPSYSKAVSDRIYFRHITSKDGSISVITSNAIDGLHADLAVLGGGGIPAQTATNAAITVVNNTVLQSSPVNPGTITSNQWTSIASISSLVESDHQRPAMGYYSYYSGMFCNPTESNILAVATNYVNDGLVALGLNWMGIDEWSYRTNGSSPISANPTNFPHGMPWLVTNLHNMGFKVDLYCEVGDGGLTCCGWPNSGGVTNTALDAATLAGWGIDGVHVDVCHDTSSDESKRWKHEFFHYCLMTNVGGNIRYTMYGNPSQQTDPTNHFAYLKFEPWHSQFNAFSWWSEYGVASTNVWLDYISHIDLASQTAGFMRPGHTPFMNVMQGDFSAYNYNMGRLQLTFWSLFQSPLMFCTDNIQMESQGHPGWAQFQTNSYVYRIDQDSLFLPPVKQFQNGTNTEIWTKFLSDGSTALALLNRWTNSESITVNLFGAGLLKTNPAAPFVLYDVWNYTNWYPASGSSITFTSPPNSVQLWILNPPLPTNTLGSLVASSPPLIVTNVPMAIMLPGLHGEGATVPQAALDIEDPSAGNLICLGDGNPHNYFLSRDGSDGWFFISGEQPGFNGVKFIYRTGPVVYFRSDTNGVVAPKFTGDGSGLTNLQSANLVGTVPAARLPLATSSTPGVVQPDNTTITISGGVITAVGGGGGGSGIPGTNTIIAYGSASRSNWFAVVPSGIFYTNTDGEYMIYTNGVLAVPGLSVDTGSTVQQTNTIINSWLQVVGGITNGSGGIISTGNIVALSGAKLVGDSQSITNIKHGNTVTVVSGGSVALTGNPDGSTNFAITVSGGGGGNGTDTNALYRQSQRRLTYVVVDDPSGTLDGFGEKVQSLNSGTRNGVAPDANGPARVQGTSGAVSGNNFGWDNNNFFPYRTGRHLRWEAYLSCDYNTSVRYVFGPCNTSGGNMWGSDLENSHQYAAFRWSTGASDVNWKLITSDAVTPTVYDTGVAFSTNMTHFEIYFDDAFNRIQWTIGANTGYVTNHIPTSINLGTVIGGSTLTTASRALTLGYFQGESDQ